MPLFFHNTRHHGDSRLDVELRDDFAITTLRHCKSEAILSERPKTSSGVIERKANRPSLQPLLPFSSISTSTSTANGFTPALVPSRNTMYDGVGIGLALGSPSEAQHPFSFGSLADAPSASIRPPQRYEQETLPPAPPYSPPPVPQEILEPMASPEKPKIKRWKTVSGLFGRKKKASNATSSPLSRISEDSAATPEMPSKQSEDKPRHSLYLKRSRKSRVPKPPSRDGSGSGDSLHLITPTPGEARAYEAANPHASPTLEINIPESGFDRYSVLFSNVNPEGAEPRRPRQSLLARRQGVESLTIKSPGLDCPPRTLPLASTRPPPSEPSLERALSEQSSRTLSSLAPLPAQSRLSAMPAPLFSKSRPALKTSQSAIGLQTIQSTTSAEPQTEAPPVEAQKRPSHLSTPRLAIFSASSPPSSPLTDAGASSSRRGSTASTASTSQFPPSPTSSTYSYYFPISAAYIRSPTLSDLPPASASAYSPSTKSPPPPFQATTESQYLAIPTPTSHSPLPPPTPWDTGAAPFPSPLCASSPSPRLKFGYDAPHSPLVAIARTVTVTVKAGRGGGQRPQFVVREARVGKGEDGLRGRSAVFVGGGDGGVHSAVATAVVGAA